MQRWADLHLHTRWSDGTQTLLELLARAKSLGLQTVAITDHDTIGPDLLFPEEVKGGLEVITGVEIKAEILGERGEILGYFVDPKHPAMRALFAWMGKAREERMKAMVQRCREVLHLPISYEEVQSRAQGSVGRPHLASLLLEYGVVTSLEEAFAQYLGDGGPCYVPLPRPTSGQVIEAIRAAGGVPVLAHPGFHTFTDWEGTLRALKSEGLMGVEVFYPYEPREKPLNPQLGWLPALVAEFGFIGTGGSDDHGPRSVKESLGMVRVPYSVVDGLRAART
ncbi:MAG: PHP domain-containing protein [Candidatus Bipolaricaulota bacterium]|nr:PHP domain-containing protein [Candidatus Bipolaricaulota bacterium]MDW8126962.1 PHP domain-containing protein [Candidatus Bipolaricaulota bacterium]